MGRGNSISHGDMFRRKKVFQRVALDRKVLNALKMGESRSGKEAVTLLIGTLQREEGEDVYRVYDYIPEALLRDSGLIGRNRNGEGVAEKIGYAEGINSRLLSKIDNGVKRANYDTAMILGFSHSHLDTGVPSGKDLHLMKYQYPKVLHLISVTKGDKIFAYNGDCDLLSIRDGTLSPEAGLQLEYRELPYNHDVEKLKNNILRKLDRRIKKRH